MSRGTRLASDNISFHPAVRRLLITSIPSTKATPPATAEPRPGTNNCSYDPLVQHNLAATGRFTHKARREEWVCSARTHQKSQFAALPLRSPRIQTPQSRSLPTNRHFVVNEAAINRNPTPSPWPRAHRQAHRRTFSVLDACGEAAKGAGGTVGRGRRQAFTCILGHGAYCDTGQRASASRTDCLASIARINPLPKRIPRFSTRTKVILAKISTRTTSRTRTV